MPSGRTAGGARARPARRGARAQQPREHVHAAAGMMMMMADCCVCSCSYLIDDDCCCRFAGECEMGLGLRLQVFEASVMCPFYLALTRWPTGSW